MSVSSLISQGYGGYQGWNDTAADADFKATGGSGKQTNTNTNTGSSGISDPVATAQKLNQFQVQQNQPAIQSLQASKQPLEQRYSDLISNIKGNQQVAENRQTVATRNELGARGIVGGGVYDQSISDAVNPVTMQFTNDLAQANTGQSTDESTINNAIAQLQSGNPSSSINSALQYSGLQQQAQQNAAQMALQQQAQNQNYGLAQQNYSLQQQQLAQQLAQQGIQNGFTKQQIGISGGNLGVAQANQNLAQQQFNYNTGNNGWQ